MESKTRPNSDRTLLELEDIRIASPCPARWQDMVGDDRVRHCLDCRLDVFDLSAMSREEATDLVRSRTERLCVGLRRRADGRVLTRDCPVGRTRRLLRWTAAAGALLLVWAIHAGLRVRGGGAATPSPTTSAMLSRAKDFTAHNFGITSWCTCSPFLFGAY